MSTHTNENDPAFPEPFHAAPGLTAREHAAIHLRVPMSGNPWLDEMITEARRWDAAQAALTNFPPLVNPSLAARESIATADFLTRQMKGESK